MTIFNNSNKERKHFKDKRSHQEINRGATTAARLEPSTPLSPARTRAARARWQGCSVERLPPAFERCSARVLTREECSLI